LNTLLEKLLVISEVPDAVRSRNNVLRNPPTDLNLAFRQDEVGPVPDESGKNYFRILKKF
jgi:hypothetical protein